MLKEWLDRRRALCAPRHRYCGACEEAYEAGVQEGRRQMIIELSRLCSHEWAQKTGYTACQKCGEEPQ
jgi:hypothetical protein